MSTPPHFVNRPPNCEWGNGRPLLSLIYLIIRKERVNVLLVFDQDDA